MELRKGIEVQAAALAARRRTPEQLAQLAEIVATMRRHLRAPDAYVETDLAFHRLIASMAHNALVYHMVGAIREAIMDALQEGMIRPQCAEQLERVQVGHEAILSALEQGDPEEAQLAMAEHFDDAVMSLVHSTMDTATCDIRYTSPAGSTRAG
jgi:DNA-binding FadR family transcriptional regulator